tara:strand:- start:1262 stop:1453 length:192 start_codon:yes stop_codon:yes gene_type:complete
LKKAIKNINYCYQLNKDLIMLLKEGDKAPEFTLQDESGNEISLKDFKNNKIVLWFFPKASTPG